GLKREGVKAPLVCVPNGIDISGAHEEIEEGVIQQFRRRFSIPEDRRVFGFLGRLDPASKGLDLLLDAFADLASSEARLVIAGPDWRGSVEALKVRARSHGLESSVIFTGPLYGG